MTEQTRGRVLLVDDEALIRMGMRTILQSLGYEVVGEAANGQDALEKVAALHPDVVIMDIKMPVLDGLEATRRLMATHPVPVIVLTAYNERSLVEEAADAGVLAYLMKPVREGDIKPAIEVARARFAELQWVGRRSGAPELEPDARSRRIAEATRVLCERHQLSEAEASARLRRLAKSSRRTVAEIAEAILALEPP
jgi:response regulator NasT